MHIFVGSKPPGTRSPTGCRNTMPIHRSGATGRGDAAAPDPRGRDQRLLRLRPHALRARGPAARDAALSLRRCRHARWRRMRPISRGRSMRCGTRTGEEMLTDFDLPARSSSGTTFCSRLRRRVPRRSPGRGCGRRAGRRARFGSRRSTRRHISSWRPRRRGMTSPMVCRSSPTPRPRKFHGRRRLGGVFRRGAQPLGIGCCAPARRLTSDALVLSKPHLSAWQVCSICLGAFGIQFGFALPQANATRIFQNLGASLDSVPLLWLAGPITGFIVQPLVGYYSDRTWTRFGRRRPYFLVGAVLAALHARSRCRMQ